MTRNLAYKSLAASALLATLLLSACGGSDDSTNTSSSSSVASSTSSVSSSAASSAAPVAMTCPATSATLYFCDDFQGGTTDNWDLTPNTGGTFAVVDTADTNGATTRALQYTAGGTASNTVIALIKDSVWANINKSDYSVEARIKPLTNGTTGSKYLFMLGRYQSATSYYWGGLNVQSSTASTQVEAGTMKTGTIVRAVQAKRAIAMDSTWYKVRFDVQGTTLTVYLDGEKIGSTTDAAFTSGKIGLMTNNKSFLIDDIKVGDAAIKPVQLTLSNSLPYAADAGDVGRTVAVTAIQSDGTTADTFTAVSDNPSVINATISGTNVTLTPLAAGTANIKFTSGSDANLSKTIVATIAPKYVDSTASYNLSGKILPAANDTAAYVDTKFQLTFDAAPTLGTAGTIRIFKSSDDSLVDTIKLSGETDTIGDNTTPASIKRRGVNTTPIKISGNVVTITPHSDKLAYGTSYYVGIANTAFTGATLGGAAFTGIGKAAGWSFTTKAAAPTTVNVTVDDDGAADFRTVQGALNFVMKQADKTAAATITVKNGTYEELMYLGGRSNVTIKGESQNGVVIQYNNHETLNSGSGAGATGTPTSGGGRAVLMAEDSDLLTLDTLTLKSSHTRSLAYSNQAEAIFFKSSTGNHRLIAKNATFYSEQDTLQLQGYNWFYNTLIAGNVDFIWGNNNASLFENSEIRMVGDSQSTTDSGGYILQARTNVGAKGFVFLNSSLTYANGPTGVKVATGANASSYLARAAAGSWEDNIAYVNCKMDTHIIGIGWAANINSNPNPNPATATAAKGWREYGSMNMAGATLDVSARSTTSYQLSASEYANGFSTRAQVFSGFSGGWNPQ